MEEERRLNSERIKNIAKNAIKGSGAKLCTSSTEFLNDLVTDFIEMMSLASLDRSVRSNHYIDSNGIIAALNDLGFADIAAELPDLSDFTEDMHQESK